jgi:hypothetical protein
VLACITVKDCKVVAICNLVRKIIITPAALGYWLPLQQVLQALCCCESSREDQMAVFNDLIDPFAQARRKFFNLDPLAPRVANGGQVVGPDAQVRGRPQRGGGRRVAAAKETTATVAKLPAAPASEDATAATPGEASEGAETGTGTGTETTAAAPKKKRAPARAPKGAGGKT